MSEPLRKLGEAVASAQDERLAARGVVAQVTSGLEARRARKVARRRAIGVALIPLAAALALLLFFALRRPSEGAPLFVPSTLIAQGDDQPFAFEDGTTVLVASGGEARVLASSAEGGHVALDRGRLRVSVPPNRGLQWAFEAGPYLVEVKGTRFDLAWDPGASRFELEMLDGKVRVSGGGVEPRLVVAGQHLSLGPDAAALSSAAPAASVTSAPSATSAPSVDPDPPAPSLSASASPSSAARASDPSRRSWQPLALEGRYAEAVALAEQGGFDAALSASSASELLLLGDACRFAGKSARAAEAYRAVRTRHANSKEAQRAIFSLGVLAFPGSGAVASFEQYLAEAPNGALAAEALGRVLEIKSRGDKAAARALATTYLARFPAGPHAKLARSLLDEPAQ